MNAFSKDVIVTAFLVWFMILGLLPAPPAYAQKQIKAAQATSVEFLNAQGRKVSYLKVGEKKWDQVSENARMACQETNRDEWSVYLSCSRPNSNRKITVVLNLFKKEITRTRPNGRVRKFPISKIGAAPDYSKANQDVTSVDYITSASGTTKFLKIADKTWRQGPEAAKLTWKETRRDESSIYLSRKNPNSGQEQKVTLNLQTKKILIYSRPGFAPTGFSISKINRTPSQGNTAATATPVPAIATVVTPTPKPPAKTSASANVIRVNVDKCPEGNIPASDGECVIRIWFVPKPGVTLSQANQIASANDWVLANRAQITEAWFKKVIDANALGMLSDGSLARPMQDDYRNLRSGTNFDSRGRADGFFIALKSADKPRVAATRSTGGSASVKKLYARRSALQPVDFFRIKPDDVALSPFHCQGDLRNLMIDGWSKASRPLLEEAGRMWLAKKKITNNSVTLKQLEEKVRNPRASNDVTRWEFAPLMLRTAWKALVAPRPTTAQLQFRKAFENYAACDENKLNRITLGMWNRHIGKGNDLSGNHWIGSVPPYKPVLLSITLTGGDTKSTEGFLPLENPLHIGANGKQAISLLYKPMMVKNIPDIDDRENLRSLDEEMTKTAVAVGLGSSFAGGAAFATAIGVVPFQNILAVGKFTKVANLEIKIRDFGDLVRSSPKVEGKTAAEVERIVAKEVAEYKAELLGKKVTKEVGEEVAEKGAKKGAQKLAKKGAEKTVKILGKKISTKVLGGALGPVLGGAAFFASVFGEVVAQRVKTDQYDKALRKGASEITPLDVRKYLADGNPAKKIKLFTQLVKMTIADPADADQLTMALPKFPCLSGDYREETTGWCIRKVGFYSKRGVTQADAEKLANQNGWQLASNFEVEEAWEFLGLNVPKVGLMTDGRYAVPIQQPYSKYKKGTNFLIGDYFTGEIDGFFYVDKRIRYFGQNGLSLAQARRKAGEISGRLATPQEVETAWKKGLDVFAYGRMSDGRFAVPVQRNKPGMRRGSNIGVRGGNQGFFYVRLRDTWRYYRGQSVMKCKPNEVYDAGLCYTPCRPGYTGVATRCYKSCPTGFRNDGLYCAKPAAYSRPGYPWRVGDPPLPNYSGPTKRCEARWGKGKCERGGAIIYPKCRPGFYAATVNLCSPRCPSGMTDIGVSCAKNYYDRGIGKPVSYCDPDKEKLGALCYPRCRRGFLGGTSESIDWCVNPDAPVEQYYPF